MRGPVLLVGLAMILVLALDAADAAPPEVRSSADIRDSGEISGRVSFCNGALSPTGTTVDLVGESYSATTGASGTFTIRFVVEGAYTLRVRVPGQPAHAQGVLVARRQVTDVGTIELCEDNDADGFTPDPNDPVGGNDCNDNNPLINPLAPELCDGFDNDCDGVVDGPICTVCTDADNDGFFAQDGCGTPIDCDDNINTVRPNAVELCDGLDNNCDTLVDEGFDFGTDPLNCGACASVCASGQCGDGICLLECGNGIVEPGEVCDDGNRIDGDGCQADCTLLSECLSDTDCNMQDGQFCNGTEVCEAGVCLPGVPPCLGPDGDADCAESCNEETDTCNAPDPLGSACLDGQCDGAGMCILN